MYIMLFLLLLFSVVFLFSFYFQTFLRFEKHSTSTSTFFFVLRENGSASKFPNFE